MGIFDKRGKHAQGASDAGATTALNKSTFNSDETKAMTPVAPAGETEPLDKSSLSSAETKAMNIPESAVGDSTMFMPKASERTAQSRDAASSAGYLPNVPVMQAASPSAAGFAAVPKKKSKRGLKAFIITFVILALILAGVYAGIATMFKTQFMPNTSIDGHDISMMSDDEVAEVINQIPKDYVIDVVGGDFSLRMTGEEVGMTIDAQSIIQAMHEEQNPWYWPWYATSVSHDESALVKTSYDQDATNALVKSAVKSFNKKATAPTNASIVFDEDSQTFTIKPEEIGTQLNAKAVQKVVNAAVADMQPKAELTDDQLKQPKLLKI